MDILNRTICNLSTTFSVLFYTMKYKHLFFDMDGTVSLSRSKITPEMKKILQDFIDADIDVVIISGSHNDQMHYQMDGLPIVKMGQNGNHAVHPVDGEMWCEVLSDTQKAKITKHTEAIWAECTHTVPDEHDLFENRGSQISFSLYGHNADVVEKKAFDGDFSRRKALLEKVPYICDETEVKIGGSTTFDYFKKGYNKGYNVNKIIEHYNWNKDDCLFYGDALFPGGNDETVVGVIKTIQVADEIDCLHRLQELKLTF